MVQLTVTIFLLGLVALVLSDSLPVDDVDVQNGDEPHYREQRQAPGATGNAMNRALTNNAVGSPEFRGHFNGGRFQDAKNFGAGVGGSAGVKVFDSGSRSVGLGAGLNTNVGLSAGRPFVSRPEAGLGVGYQQGRFSASAGMGRNFGRGGGNTYGVGIGYRFKRSLQEDSADDDVFDDTDDDHNIEYTKYERYEPEDRLVYRARRQANQNAMDRALSNKPVGQLDYQGHYYGGQFQDPKNFGARVGGSVGMKVYENGPHSVGVGAGLDVNAGVAGGKPFVNKPDVGVGAGYTFRFRRALSDSADDRHYFRDQRSQ